MADEQVTIPVDSDKVAEARAELRKAVIFAAEDSTQMAELAEALLDVYPATGENAYLVAKAVAGRLFSAGQMVMRSVKEIPAEAQDEVAHA